MFRFDPGGLRRLAHACEVFRIEPCQPMDQIVGNSRPGLADGRVTDVMAHARSAGRKQVSDVPRSRCTRNCARSTASRKLLSLILSDSIVGICERSPIAAI